MPQKRMYVYQQNDGGDWYEVARLRARNLTDAVLRGKALREWSQGFTQQDWHEAESVYKGNGIDAMVLFHIGDNSGVSVTPLALIEEHEERGR